MAAQRLALVTRPEPQAGQWVRRLADLGVAAQALPLLSIDGAPDPSAVQAELLGWAEGDLVMFVSPNAAAQCLDCAPLGWHWPAGVTAAATGPGTVTVLREHGVPESALVWPDPAVAQWDSEHLWMRLQRQDWRGRRAWIVRGEAGRDWLADTLRGAGAQVGFVTAYVRRVPIWQAAQRELLDQALAAPQQHVWLLSSSEAVRHLADLAPGADWRASMALASHPRIAQTARDLGFGQVHLVQPSADAVASWWMTGA